MPRHWSASRGLCNPSITRSLPAGCSFQKCNLVGGSSCNSLTHPFPSLPFKFTFSATQQAVHSTVSWVSATEKLLLRAPAGRETDRQTGGLQRDLCVSRIPRKSQHHARSAGDDDNSGRSSRQLLYSAHPSKGFTYIPSLNSHHSSVQVVMGTVQMEEPRHRGVKTPGRSHGWKRARLGPQAVRSQSTYFSHSALFLFS